jgi:hypothetical protein
MNLQAFRTWLPVAIALAVIVSAGEGASGYSSSGPVWRSPVVSYRLNPANLDLAETPTETAVRAGADAWALQAASGFRFNYAGRSTQTTTTFDSLNLVLFRNASSGSAIATTYTWYNSTGIVDADIVFWDEAFRFFSGASGCSIGFFIEDIATHEFGHALGLGHSTTIGATMYPTVSYCSIEPRSLHADDIAGLQSLYPPAVPPPGPPIGVRIR